MTFTISVRCRISGLPLEPFQFSGHILVAVLGRMIDLLIPAPAGPTHQRREADTAVFRDFALRAPAIERRVLIWKLVPRCGAGRQSLLLAGISPVIAPKSNRADLKPLRLPALQGQEPDRENVQQDQTGPQDRHTLRQNQDVFRSCPDSGCWPFVATRLRQKGLMKDQIHGSVLGGKDSRIGFHEPGAGLIRRDADQCRHLKIPPIKICSLRFLNDLTTLHHH